MTVHIKNNPDGSGVVLTASYDCALPFGWSVVVPEGFVSDGASIPRWAWPIVGPPLRGKHLEPAVVHDYLCERSFKLVDYEARVMADAAFFLLLKRFGVPYWKRALMYVAVRFWGRYTYSPRGGR